MRVGVEGVVTLMLGDSLVEAVDSSRPGMVAFTQELVAIATENPPGKEYLHCAEVIAQKLEDLGLRPRIVKTESGTEESKPGYCVLASHGEGERVLYFHGHYDVVPRSMEGQLDPVIRGANLFGRGSTDMKSGLAAMVYAVHALRATKTALNGRIELVIVPDEETGGERGTAALSQSADFAKSGIDMLLGWIQT